MDKPPKWFTVLSAVAFLWNLAGLAAVLADLGHLSLNQADIAAMPDAQRAMYVARPGWSIAASVVAVVGGTLGSLALLFRRRWAQPPLYASLVGVVLQDIALIFIFSKAAQLGTSRYVLQVLVFAVAVGLVVLARRAASRGWLR